MAANEPQLPDDLPLLRRRAVRVVLLDVSEQVLLFHTRDIDHPDLGEWWELPGGGLDGTESYSEAAVREIREETGIRIDPSQVAPANWSRCSSFRHRQQRHLQDERVAAVRLATNGPDVDESWRLDYELEDYFDFRWWPVSEIIDSTERFYPGRLPVLLPAFLRGEKLREPFELWS